MGALDEGVEDVEDGVAAPGVGVFPQHLGFFVIGVGPGDAVAVAAKGFELVDEFVDDVPCPVTLDPSFQLLVRETMFEGGGGLTEGTSRSTGPSEFRM